MPRVTARLVLNCEQCTFSLRESQEEAKRTRTCRGIHAVDDFARVSRFLLCDPREESSNVEFSLPVSKQPTMTKKPSNTRETVTHFQVLTNQVRHIFTLE